MARRVFLLLLFALAGCDLFSTRAPEPPVAESGTFRQPDTPDQVIANLQAAITEMNAQNYRRSFAEAFTFTPTDHAMAQNASLWNGWGRDAEERYFSTLVAAARLTTGNALQLTDETLSVVDETRFVLDATYLLTINHRRPNLPVTFQGRLVWTLQQGPDGLWRLQEWTDRAAGAGPSWSDLKAEFAK